MHIILCHVCSVLDLNAFERQNKAEGLGMVSEEGTSKLDTLLFNMFFMLIKTKIKHTTAIV